MLKKLIVALLVVIMVMSLFTGCSKSTTPTTDTTDANSTTDITEEPSNIEEETLVWRMGFEPRSFDPQQNYSSGHIIQNIYEGLFAEKIGGIEPAVAESYEISDDGCKYTFKLREGVKWSDGQPVTAKDFEYAWKRLCNPETAATTSYMMTPYIKGALDYLTGKGTAEDMCVKAVDDVTLEVELNNPTPFFINLTAYYAYSPSRKDIIEKYGEGWDMNPETCISNGAFKLEEIHTGSHVILTKNENYWNVDNVKIKRIKGLILNDDTTALNGYQAGEIDCMPSPPQDEIPRLIAEDPNLTIIPAIGTAFVLFNMDAEPVNDIRVRKALSLAIDRKRIVEQVTKGGEMAASGYVPYAFKYSEGTSFRQTDKYGKAVIEYGIDPNKAKVEEARALLADAGYPNGEGFPKIEYLYNTGEGSKKLAEALQEMWKENLNIEIELRNEDRSVYNENTLKGNYVIAKGSWWGDYADPMTMFETFQSYAGNNKMQWRWCERPVIAPHDKKLNPENKRFDDIIKKAQATTGEERDKWLRSAEEIIMEENVVAPIYFFTDVIIINKSRVEGIGLTPVGFWTFKDGKLIN